MKFKEFLDKVEKEYFIDGEQNEEFWDDESGYMQLLNEDNMREAFDILSKGGNISAVFRYELPDTYKSYKVINADESDLRFTDEVNVICGLKAKGKAIKDYSGFVLE